LPDLRNARLVIGRRHIAAFFSTSPEASERLEMLTDYAKRYGGEVWVCDSHFERVRAGLKGDLSLEGYLKSLFKDGAALAGSASFGSEDQDMLFLAGLLYSTDGARPVVLIHDAPDRFLQPNLSHVLAKLGTLGIEGVSWRVLSLDQAVELMRQDPDFAAFMETLR
jgi:hypothetical protein